jgi:ABC-type transport system involved in cytochrome bd biosynthesis fused ATPase/permease subunit
MRIERRGTGAFMNDRQRKTAISIRGLIKRYPDGTVANRGIDLDVFEGEVLSILGPNGAGKTTLVRQITTELNPTSGSSRSRTWTLPGASQGEAIDGCHSLGGCAVLALNGPRASLFFRAFEGAYQRQRRRAG